MRDREPPGYTVAAPELGKRPRQVASPVLDEFAILDPTGNDDKIVTVNATGDGFIFTDPVDVSGYAPLASPTFTGTPAAPTAAPGTNTTQLATTAFVTGGLSSKQDTDTQLTSLAGLVYASNALKVIRVNAGETAFELVTPSGGGLSDADYGDITVSGAGTAMTIDPGVVTLAKQADMATASVVYRKTAGVGSPEVQTLATLKTDLGLTGTNSGDQATIVGITGTLAEFNAALTGADFATGGGTATGTNTGDQTTITGNAGTATALQTGRTISITGKATSAGGTFDGTGDLALNVTAVTLVAGDIPTIAQAQVTNLVTDLAGKQPLDTQLTDFAALTYVGNALKLLRVNAGATGLEFAAGGGGGGTTITSGTATIDFGAFPGASDTSLAIIGQAGILSTSVISIAINAIDTADHSALEHLVDPPRLAVGDIIPGTGFTVYGFTTNTRRHYGLYSVVWTWS